MSEPEKKVHKIDVASAKLVPLNTFLHAYMREKGLKPHHYPGLIAFAGNRRKATKDEWNKLFSTY